MKDAILIIIMKNCNDFQVHPCVECMGELEAAKDQGSSRLQTSHKRSCFQCKRTNSCFLKPTLRWKYKQLLSTSTPYAGGANKCFLNQPVRWWYITMLELQPYAGGTNRLLSESNPYAGGTNSCFLNQPLRWWYNPTLVVLTPPTSPPPMHDVTVMSSMMSLFRKLGRLFSLLDPPLA